MAKCEHKLKHQDDYVCYKEALEKPDEDGKRRCIFHSTREDKNLEEKFYEGFINLYKEKKHDYTGFIFPKNFSFSNFKSEMKRLKFENVKFFETIFYCDVDFSGTEFFGNRMTDFRYAEFHGNGKTSFDGVKFTCKRGTDFRWARFKSTGGTSFSNTQFFDEKEVNFGRARFLSKGLIDFKYAEFSEECKIRFLGETFYGETEADFRILHFINPDKVYITFDDVNLNRCRFLGTDLEKINFTKVYWTGRKYDSPSYKGRIRVYDEDFQYRGRFLRIFEGGENEKDNLFKAFFRKIGILFVSWLNASKPKEKEDNHYAVHLLYNQLIKNYEKTNRYHEAGDFFAGMMEMRRRREKFEKRRFRILLWFYRLVSLYGERPFWAAGWLLFILLLFGIIYKCFGIVYPPKTSICFLKDLCNGLMISLDVMTIGRIKPLFGVKVHPIIPFIKGVQTLITATLLSLFILAMNRKFRRTKD